MKQSAGILLYRMKDDNPEFFLVHPGGPFFAKRHEGWWTIPKGEPEEGESLQQTAVREFQEETGSKLGKLLIPLLPIIQKGGKQVHAWLCEGNINPETITCNYFEIEWPPKSGKKQSFPEVDKAGWFTPVEAKLFINERQVDLIEQAVKIINRL